MRTPMKLVSLQRGVAALGFVATMADLPKATNKGGTLYVFALP